MAYDQIFQNVISNVFRNYPRGIGYSSPTTSGASLFLPANQPVVPTPAQLVAAGQFNPATTDYRNWATNSRIAQPYTLQFSFGVERQLFVRLRVQGCGFILAGRKSIKVRPSSWPHPALFPRSRPPCFGHAQVLGRRNPLRNA